MKTDEEIQAFLDEIEAVCRKHGLIIAHEDQHGSFIVEPLSESGIKWLRAAVVQTDPATVVEQAVEEDPWKV